MIEYNKILVVMEEGIGNMVMLTPTLKALKKQHPESELTVYCKKPASEVIEGWKVVDRIIHEPDSNHYDICFLTIWSGDAANKHSTWFQTHCKNIVAGEIEPGQHESFSHFEAAHFSGYKGDRPSPYCKVKKVSMDLPEKYIVISDTALEGWEKKRWPHYKELARMLIDSGHKVILVGGKSEAESFKPEDWPVVINLTGILTVPETAYIIKNSDMFIGNDSGPAHIAAALNVDTFVFFGPTILTKNQPIGNKVVILSTDMKCIPCQYSKDWKTCGSNNCLSDIKPETVMDHIEEFKKRPDDYYGKEVKITKSNKRILIVGVCDKPESTNTFMKRGFERLGYSVDAYNYRTIAEQVGQEEMWSDFIKFLDGKKYALILFSKVNGLHPELIERAKAHGKTWYWFMDNLEVAKAIQAKEYANRTDYASATSQEVHDYFASANHNSFRIVEGFDPQIYKPKDFKKEIDVLFVGNATEKRVKDLGEITKHHNVEIYGYNWPDEFNAKKPIFNNDLNDAICRSKIILNLVHSNIYSDRVTLTMAAGGFVLSQYCEDIEKHFSKGVNIEYFKNIDEACKLIDYYLENEKARDGIAENGCSYVRENFSWESICWQILNKIQDAKKLKILYLTPPGFKDVKTPQMLMADELSRQGHEVDLVITGQEIKIEDKTWDVVFSAMEASIPVGSEIARDFNLPHYAHGEWIPPWRVGLQSPKEWGFYDDNLPTDSDYSKWSDYYKPIVAGLLKADLATMAGRSFVDDVGTLTGQKLDWPVKFPYVNIKQFDIKPQKKENQIITISRLEPNKKVAMTAEALKLLNLEVTWVIIGYGSEEERIKNILEGSKVKVKILKGLHQEEKFQEIRKSLFAIQNWSGIPPAEAMFNGIPCISMDHPYMLELYNNTLIWGKNNDIENQARLIKQLLATPEKTLYSMAREGARNIMAGNTGVQTIDKAAGVIVKYLSDAIENHKTGAQFPAVHTRDWKPNLSIGMIVKNEEKNLHRCLDSFLPVIQMKDDKTLAPLTELIIVDTGSTDRTLDVARKYTDQVYIKEITPWHFSKARNYSVSKCSGDWFMYIDADEELSHGSLYPMMDLVLNPRYKVFNSLFVWFRNYYNNQMQGFNKFHQPRIFKREGFYFENAIHNQALCKPPFYYAKDVWWNHYGYQWETDYRLIDSKTRRTLPLLIDNYKRNPNDTHALTHIIKTFRTLKDDDSVIDYGKKWLNAMSKINYHDGWFAFLEVFPQMIDSYLRRGDDEMALKIEEEAREYSKDIIDVPLILGFHFRNKDEERAEKYFEEVLRIHKTGKDFYKELITTNYDFHLAKIYNYLARVNFLKGNLKKAGQFTRDGIGVDKPDSNLRWDFYNYESAA